MCSRSERPSLDECTRASRQPNYALSFVPQYHYLCCSFFYVCGEEEEEDQQCAVIVDKGEDDDGAQIYEITLDDLNKDKNVLYKFLDKNASKMPRVMLRYSLEKMDKNKKNYYMHL